MDLTGLIEVTGADLRVMVKAAYELSVPVGLGMLHFTLDDLSDEEIDSLINPTGRIAVSMDYVRGRACKFTVWREVDTGRLFIRNEWFDHRSILLDEVLRRVGISAETFDGCLMPQGVF